MIANGRSTDTVINELKSRGMSSEEMETCWQIVESRGIELLKIRRRRLRQMGMVWAGIGSSLLIALVWSSIAHGSIPFILLIGLIPLAYGVYLFRLSPTEEPSIDPPNIFGRNL